MKNIKIIIIPLLITSLIIIGIIITRTIRKKATTPSIIIGILQTASHPALDAVRNGFIDEVQKSLSNNVNFIIRNAEGSIANTHTIANHFHADPSIAAIYTIATPALQAMASVEKEKPIFFAAVTDPYPLNIIHKKTNITGITDMIDISSQINAMVQLVPAISTVALVYNPAETNSVIQIKNMEKELIKYSIKPIHIGISTETEIPQAITSALSKADALLVPADNLIASAMPIISRLAREAQKPLIASHNQAVEQGALMARGVDYYACGKEIGKIALSILHMNKKPHEIPIHLAKTDNIMINRQVIKELGLEIPTSLKNEIIFVESVN